MLRNWSLTGLLLLSGLMGGETLAVAPPTKTVPVQEPELSSEVRIAQRSSRREPLVFEGELSERSQVLAFDDSYFNSYTFTGRAGESIQIDLVSDDFDSYLLLFDPNSNTLVEDDDGGEGLNARITITLPLDGEYEIWANSSRPGEVGDYRLTVQGGENNNVVSEQLESPSFLEQPEFPHGLLIESGLRRAWSQVFESDGSYFNTHDFYGRAGDIIQLDLLSDEFDSRLILLDPNANILMEKDDGGENQNARITITLPMDGEYQVLASTNTPGEGGVYTLTFHKIVTEPTELTVVEQAEELVEAGQLLRWEETVASWQAAIEKWEAALLLYQSAGDRLGEANTLRDIAALHSGLGDNQRALDYYNQALPLFRAVNEQRGEATTLNNIGAIYNALGDRQRALDFFNQALPLFQAVGDRLNAANTLNNIGAIYNALGDEQQALDYYNQALPLLRGIGAQLSEADALRERGHYQSFVARSDSPLRTESERERAWEQALESYNQALQIYQEVGDRHGEAYVLRGISRLYRDRGQRGVAASYAHQARLISGIVQLDHRRSDTIILNDLDGLQSDRGNQQRALDYYSETLSIAREIEDWRAEAIALQNIGRIYHHRDEQQQALDYYDQALTLLRRVEDWRSEAITLDNIGQSHNALGNEQQAIEFFNQALALRRTVGDRNGEAITLWNIANAQRSQGQLTTALTNIQAAIALIERLRSLTPPGELRQTYFATVQGYYQFQLNLLVELQQQNPNSPENYAAQAFQISESIRARTLIEQLSEANLDIRQGVPPNLLSQEQDLIQQLNAAEQQRITLLKGNYSNAQLNVIKTKINQTLQDLKDTESHIRQQSPAYAQLKFPAPLTLEDVQNKILNDDTLLLEYALGERQSYLFLASKSGLQIFTLPAQADIEAAVEVYRNQLQDRTFTDISQGQALSEMLLGPVAHQLGNKRLLIVSNGKLQLLPFSALPVPVGAVTAQNSYPKEVSAAGGIAQALPEETQPLLTNHEIIALPSATSLAVQRQTWQNRETAPKQLAIFADPVFQKNDRRLGDNANTSTVGDLSQSQYLDALTRAGCTTFSRLPYTAAEAKQILEFVPDAQEFSALGFAANYAAITDPDLSQYQILHLATHGCIQDDARLSGLALSFYQENGEPTENNRLNLQDIYNLELNAELVVLSACQTGIGENVAGEGVVGLTSGFLYAGVKRVVVSLWNVNDQATAVLMSGYYQQMLDGGRDPNQALRQAQLALWNGNEYRAPFYWAAFTIQGEF
ncbi:MAG: CHAT domain-containing protein [Cyanobacteria bacterium P01_G01_bin.54]